MATDQEYWQARLDKIELMIEAYEDAILAITEQGYESYRLDTGQTVINVKQHDLPGMQNKYNALLSMRSSLKTRLTGCGTTTSGPGW